MVQIAGAGPHRYEGDDEDDEVLIVHDGTMHTDDAEVAKLVSEIRQRGVFVGRPSRHNESRENWRDNAEGRKRVRDNSQERSPFEKRYRPGWQREQQEQPVRYMTYGERLTATKDIFSAEAIMQEISDSLFSRPELLDRPNLRMMVRANRMVEVNWTPPCTFFDIGLCEYKEALVHQVVTAYMAAARSGTKAQKNRSAVRGGGAKPFRQKGTGRARQGTIRSPIMRGGGVTFAASPRNYEQ